MKKFIDLRIQRSTKAIQIAFLSFLKTKPIHQISVSEIVRKAGYNRGTFYAHFTSKEQLLQEIIDETLDEMVKQIRVPYKELITVDLSKMDQKDITLFYYFQNEKELYKILLSHHVKVDFRHQMALAIEKLFVEEYDYEITSETLDVKWLYIYRSHGIAGMIIRWIEDDFQTAPNVMAQQAIDLMLVSTEVFRVKNKSITTV